MIGELNSFVEIIGSWLAYTGMAVAVLVLFVLLIRRPVARYFGAKVAYALWTLPVLRVFMPTVTVPSWLHLGEDEVATELASAGARGFDYTLMEATPLSPQVSWMFYIILLWAVVGMLLIARSLLRHNFYRRKTIQTSRIAGRDIEICVQKIAAQIGLKNRIHVRVSNENEGPLVMGVIRPCIVLPKNFIKHFTSEQQELALLHELLHIRRRDLWAALAALIFGALNWPNPFMRLAVRAFRHDQEAACDLSVLNHPICKGADRVSYAQTLMQAATLCSSTPAEMPLGLSIHHPLKERIMSLKNPTPTARLRPRLIGASALAAAFMLTAPYSLADPAEELAGKSVKTHSIMKIVSDDNGEKTKKTIEITKNGDSIEAWETNELTGERRKLETSELGDMDIQIMEHSGGMKVMKFHGSEGEFNRDMELEIEMMDEIMDLDSNGKIKKRIMIMGDQSDMIMSHDIKKHIDGDKNVFVMKMHKDGTSHSHIATEAKISAAIALLGDEMDGEDVSEDVRRSLKKARKALEKAQRKLEAEK